MSYTTKLKLRDTTLESGSMSARNTKATDILSALKSLGIPEYNIIIQKVDTQVSTFTNLLEEKIVETLGGEEEGNV